jgi:hypothetical protein
LGARPPTCVTSNLRGLTEPAQYEVRRQLHTIKDRNHAVLNPRSHWLAETLGCRCMTAHYAVHRDYGNWRNSLSYERS